MSLRRLALVAAVALCVAVVALPSSPVVGVVGASADAVESSLFDVETHAWARIVEDLADEMADGGTSGSLLEVDSHDDEVANHVAHLSDDEFAALLRQRNPMWLELQQTLQADVEAGADVEIDVETEAASEADAESDAEAEAEAETDVEVETDDAALLEVEVDTESELPGLNGACGTGGTCKAKASCNLSTHELKTGKCAGTPVCCQPKKKAATPAKAPAAKAPAAKAPAAKAPAAKSTTAKTSVASTAKNLASAAGAAMNGAGRAAGKSGTIGGKSGTIGGAAGGIAGKSGTIGGKSGTIGGKSGTIGGKSGTIGGKSGTIGGKSGTIGAKSGTIGGTSGHPTIVQPKYQITQYLTPMKTPKDYPDPKVQLCHAFFRMYLRRYGFGFDPAAVARITGYNHNPYLFCTESTTRSAQKATQAVYAEVLKYPGKPMVNSVVSTKASSIDQQLQCGSCWAQAAIGSFEIQLKKKGIFRGELSVQQIIDCVKGPAYPESQGCVGGTPMDALKYLKTHGAALQSAYPYTGRQGTCRESLGANGPKSSGWDLVHFSPTVIANTKRDYSVCTTASCSNQWQFEMDLVLAVKTDGPYIAWVDATHWQRYNGGVFPTSACSSTLEAGNHIIELLGYGQQGGLPYWLVKNSWGTGWGESGYIRLEMGVNACGLINYMGKANKNVVAGK